MDLKVIRVKPIICVNQTSYKEIITSFLVEWVILIFLPFPMIVKLIDIVCLQEFSKLCGDSSQLMMLLDRINSQFIRSHPSVLQALMRLIPFLAFGDQEKMLALINHFKPYLNFDK